MSEIHGHCRICGFYRKLTEEHIPPKKAFNNDRLHLARPGYEDPVSPREYSYELKQGGFKQHVLCKKCNDTTGGWYGNAYIDWAKKGAMCADSVTTGDITCELHGVRPLPILKQVCAMFLASNQPRFQSVHSDMVRFVLNRRESGLSPKYYIYVYLNPSQGGRRIGISVMMNHGQVLSLSEIGAFPFGYVLSFERPIIDNPYLADITWFAKYKETEVVDVQLRFQVGHVASPYPLDFRDLETIEREALENASKPQVPATEENVAELSTQVRDGIALAERSGMPAKDAQWRVGPS